MANTPRDMLKYVLDNELESDFLTANVMQKNDYSIGEIPDKRFVQLDDKIIFHSRAYHINVEVEDDDIITAFLNKLYISAFVSRKGDDFQVHFLVHKYPESMKGQFEDEITDEVLEYMILRTIVTLQLDTIDKIKNYCK